MNAHNIAALLAQHGQAAVDRIRNLLPADARARLERDLAAVDWAQVAQLQQCYQSCTAAVAAQPRLEPAPLFEPASEAERAHTIARGEACLAAGRVAALLVAGGQGTRLGFDGPKGCFPLSPVRQASLFQLFAEQIRALGRRYGITLPWIVMTSRQNHQLTIDFFAQHDWFGLPADSLRFVQQGELPALSPQGALLVAPDGTLQRSPNGHGGALEMLEDARTRALLDAAGVTEIFYFQVDNPLVRIADPLFVGAHIQAAADMSSKVVRKEKPEERVGILGLIDGAAGCIEYSELGQEQARLRLPDGRLRFGSANIAVHMLNRDFVRRVVVAQHLPLHIARKQIPCLRPEAGGVVSETIEGIKFERFVFDALRYAVRTVTLEVSRAEEFAPVKNRSGADSPESARRAMSAQARRRLTAAGWRIPDDATIELSPQSVLAADDRHPAASSVTPAVYVE